MIDKSSIKISDCNNSNYIKVKQMDYIENGIQKTWDFISSHNSVSILLYNHTNDSIIIVKQFRPAVFINNNDGYMYELCAGLIDKKGKNIEQIALEEVFEECGYKANNIKQIAQFYNSVGNLGSKEYVFFSEVSNKEKINNGGGIDNEQIQIIEIPRDEMLDFLGNTNITPTLAFAFIWFINNFKTQG